jgi:DNA adenine methylase
MIQLSLLPDVPAYTHDVPINVATVPQRSVFRYPGGKTWLVPHFRHWINNLPQKPRLLIEPFAGGGIIGLTTAFEKLANEVLLVELDNQVAAVWKTLLSNDSEWLAEKILRFKLNTQTAKDLFTHDAPSNRDKAFQVIVRNRIAHGGILTEGAGILKNGENGRGISSRWYPQTLARRIHDLQSVKNTLTFIHGNAFEIIEEHSNSTDICFFIDPPYTAGGKCAGNRLYTHSTIDHERLFQLCKNIKGNFLMSYDNCENVRELASRHNFATKPVAMKNTHHAEMSELLISNILKLT